MMVSIHWAWGVTEQLDDHETAVTHDPDSQHISDLLDTSRHDMKYS